MKIIWKDNFDREHIDDRLVAENIQSARECEIMLKALRAICSDSRPDWYVSVEDDYVLHRFEP